MGSDRELSEMRGTQETIKIGMEKQLQVVESILDIFYRSSHASERNFNKLHTMLRNVYGYFRNSTERLATRQQFDESLGILDRFIEMFLGDVKDIAKLFTGMTSGSVDPLIPEKFTRYLTETLSYMPKGYSFPRSVARENAAVLLPS